MDYVQFYNTRRLSKFFMRFRLLRRRKRSDLIWTLAFLSASCSSIFKEISSPLSILSKSSAERVSYFWSASAILWTISIFVLRRAVALSNDSCEFKNQHSFYQKGINTHTQPGISNRPPMGTKSLEMPFFLFQVQITNLYQAVNFFLDDLIRFLKMYMTDFLARAAFHHQHFSNFRRLFEIVLHTFISVRFILVFL